MDRLDKFYRQFGRAVLKKGKKVIIGGYDLHGVYCNWLLEKIRGYGADMIVDNDLCTYGVKIYRELQVADLDPREYIVIVPFDKSYDEMFHRYDIETVVLSKEFGCEGFSYYEWLEAKYGVDLLKTINRKDFDYDWTFATNSGASRQMGLIDVIGYLEEHVLFFYDGLKALDVGCGKGGAIELLQHSSLARVDGIELSKSISEIAKRNMELLGNDVTIQNVSATEFDGYADYDILYLYDPFRGDVFRSALRKFEEAAKKRNRPMLLVYANPYHHRDIVEGGIFKQIASIDTDFFHRNVKVYASAEVMMI